MKEVASKTMDGISDLVVFAPIREGFIKAFETVTYASRLEIVSNALNRLRVAAREYERVTPYSDVTERILSLLDFRVGVIDEDLFGLARSGGGKHVLKPKRHLYLTATFEGGFEPYMRQIWRPLGPFLDLLFCNCEDYVTATEHSFDEYVQWVRDNQMDSAIFYNTTGITVRDQKYLSSFEKAQRAQLPGGGLPERDADLARHTMAYPEDEAGETRTHYFPKAAELGFEALNVLYKLTDYFPPEWQTGPVGGSGKPDEGHRLMRATRELLLGWEDVLAEVDRRAAADPKGPFARALKTYKDPLDWYRSGAVYLDKLDGKPPPEDPEFVRGQVQSGILKPHGSRERPVSHGALMMFTVRNAESARSSIARWVKKNVIRFGDNAPPQDPSTVFANIAFTSQGLLELGIDYPVHDCLPKEFREGLAQRSSQVGDMRENHPRNWILPERNGPAFLKVGAPDRTLPPVELDEIDFVLQLRGFDEDAVRRMARDLASKAAPGATLEAIDWLHVELEDGSFRDHFGYIDGISQPRVRIPREAQPVHERDKVALGEVLLGYGNDRGDGPPTTFDDLDGEGKPSGMSTAWRTPHRKRAQKLLKNGSFFVIRKIGQEKTAFDAWLDSQKAAVAEQLGCSQDEAHACLKAAVMGRDVDGNPLKAGSPTDKNDFDYEGDLDGIECPHAAHIRRANPRRWNPDHAAPVETRREFERPTPRLVRRGMLFGKDKDKSRGLIFMAYAASIAEQYEVIQRWLNGGNPTDVASANNDPLTGVRPKDGSATFRFFAEHKNKTKVVVRAELPLAYDPRDPTAPPGRHPFTPLYWGLYLFTPSLAALKTITGWKHGYRPLREMLENAVGQVWIDKLEALPTAEAAEEWKRLIEDFVAKDPSERDISPHLWSAIRYYYGGALDISAPLDGGLPTPALEAAVAREVADHDWTIPPDVEKQNVILCAGQARIRQVLTDWEDFTSEEQLRRIIDHAGPIYVTQQPDNQYFDHSGKYSKLNYHEESAETNKILFNYKEKDGFIEGYKAGKKVLDGIKKAVEANSPSRKAFKIELRRQYIQPAMAEVWRLWYGLPDDKTLHGGAWSWKKLVKQVLDDATERSQALCPGDFMAPSRGSVFPRPNASIEHYAEEHGAAIREAGLAFVERLHHDPTLEKTPLIEELFFAYREPEQKAVLARNIVGTMIGAIPPMDANLRNVILEWLIEKRLWRHQAGFKAATAGKDLTKRADEALEALRGPVSQAICKRPAPDLLFRTAKHRTVIVRADAKDGSARQPAIAEEGDLVVVSLASASQRSLHRRPDGDVSIVFGGERDKPLQGYAYKDGVVTPRKNGAVHACPAQEMAMGGMIGILAAFLDAGTIQALPASLIVRISDW